MFVVMTRFQTQEYKRLTSHLQDYGAWDFPSS